MALRRTVRDFSERPVPLEVIDNAIRAAATAPSGANLQPWRFVVLTDPVRKRALREAAEAEEREFYGRRASEEWLAALAPLGTDWHKPFLEDRAGGHRGVRGAQGARDAPALLRQGVGGDRRRVPAGGAASGGVGDAHAYAEPDAVPQRGAATGPTRSAPTW